MTLALPSYPEVSTTVPEHVPLTLREQILKTLICPGCKFIFRAPVATCTLGHSTCYACSTRLNECAVCTSPLGSTRNYTIESQLNLIEVECGIPHCSKRITAANLYEHFAKCEFRTIHCRLPIMHTGTPTGGARIDCAAVLPFDDYVHHLTQIHGAKCYQFIDPNNNNEFYNVVYNASSDDFFRCPESISTPSCPIPLILGNKKFLLHSELKEQKFNLWVSAMCSEEEARRYTASIQLITVMSFDAKNKFPKWEIRAHNYHVNKNRLNTIDRVTMQPTLLRHFAEINGGQWAWTIICHIEKDTSPKDEPLEIIVD